MTIQCLPVQGRGWLERSQAIGMGLSALWHCPFPPDKSGSEVCWEHGCTYRSVSLQGEKCTEAWKAEEFQAQCGSLQCLKPLLYCGPCFPAACSESLGTLGRYRLRSDRLYRALILSSSYPLTAFISGPWELRQTLHLLQFLPLLHMSRFWFHCTAEEREPSGKLTALTWGAGSRGDGHADLSPLSLGRLTWANWGCRLCQGLV